MMNVLDQSFKLCKIIFLNKEEVKSLRFKCCNIPSNTKNVDT